MSAVLKRAVFDKTVTDYGSHIKTGEQHIAIIEVDGVQFRSWLPNSEAECAKMNAVAAAIVARSPEMVEELQW